MERKGLGKMVEIENILESISDGFFSLDSNFHVIYFNKAAEKLLGRKREDILNKNLFDSFPEAKDSIFEEKYSWAIHNKQFINFITYFEVTPYRNWYDVRVYPMQDGISVYFQVVTERKEAEQKLKEKEETLRVITENVQDAIFTKNKNREYTYVNEAAAKMMNLTVEQIIGKKAEDIFLPEDYRQIKEVDDLNFQGRVVNDTKKISIGNRVKYLHTSQNPIMNQQNEIIGISGIVKDITENIISENKIKQLLEEKELLLKEVHHRIKNNIISMESILSLHANSIQNTDTLPIINDAISRVRTMRLIYEKLLLTIDYQNIPIKSYIEELINLLLSLYPMTKNISFELDIDNISFSPKQIQSIGIILNEILTNILKYAFINLDSGIVKISLKKFDEKISLIVQDNGNGFPKNFNANNSASLGLILIKAMCEQLHGTCKFTNNNGAKIFIEFNIFD